MWYPMRDLRTLTDGLGLEMTLILKIRVPMNSTEEEYPLLEELAPITIGHRVLLPEEQTA